MDFEYSEGATPLDPDEAEGLLLPHISTRGELDEFEQANIAEAQDALDRAKHFDPLSEESIRRVHKLMFCDVWAWAGTYRRTDKNIGCPWFVIPQSVGALCDDARTWCQCKSYPPLEIGARFHHRLVSIHPFANGNGRHARAMADLLMKNTLHETEFTWGRCNLVTMSATRARYLEALKSADQHDYELLLEFVVS